MSVRLFGGFNFDDQDLSDIVSAGYSKGVAMGGEIKTEGQASPSFLVSATMDPESASLDRIQIIKGWIDEGGETHEKIQLAAQNCVKDGKIRILNHHKTRFTMLVC